MRGGAWGQDLAGGEQRPRRRGFADRLCAACPERPERAGPESRWGEAGEEVASSAPPPGLRWAPLLLAWGSLSFKSSKRKTGPAPAGLWVEWEIS